MSLIHFMTGIPTVIYGFVSVIFLVPLVRGAFPESTGYSWLTAALGFSRALGDTIIALMVAGNAPQVPNSLLDSIRTLTSHIALVVATDSTSQA
jgi:phosphate transport system permease protein